VDVQLGPDKQDQERAQDGKDDTGWVKRTVSSRAYKKMRDKSGHDRTNNAEHDRTDQGKMQMHNRFGHEPGNETNN